MQDAMGRVFNRFPELRTTVHVDDMKLNLRVFCRNASAKDKGPG